VTRTQERESHGESCGHRGRPHVPLLGPADEAPGTSRPPAGWQQPNGGMPVEHVASSDVIWPASPPGRPRRRPSPGPRAAGIGSGACEQSRETPGPHRRGGIMMHAIRRFARSAQSRRSVDSESEAGNMDGASSLPLDVPAPSGVPPGCRALRMARSGSLEDRSKVLLQCAC